MASIFSSLRSTLYSLRGLRFLFRLWTGKRMGFSLRGPAGMRLHYNSDGALRSFSLKSFGGMRVICESDGRFKSLSIPGIFKSRVYVNSKGELTGFGLPRMFGGFLLFDNQGRLKRSYGPVVGDSCLSKDANGKKTKHKISGQSKEQFIEKEVRSELPDTHKTYVKKGEVTEKGTVPIPDKDIELFRKDKEGKFESEKKVTNGEKRTKLAVDKDNEQMSLSDIKFNSHSDSRVTSTTNENVAEESIEKTEEPIINESPIQNSKVTYANKMSELDKAVEEAFPDQEEVSFDDYCALEDDLKK